MLQLNLRLTLSEISALFLPTRYPFLHVLITKTFSNAGSPEGSLTGFNFQLRTVSLSHNLEGLLPFFWDFCPFSALGFTLCSYGFGALTGHMWYVVVWTSNEFCLYVNSVRALSFA